MKKLCFLTFSVVMLTRIFSQTLHGFVYSSEVTPVIKELVAGSERTHVSLPLFSLELNGSVYHSDSSLMNELDKLAVHFEKSLSYHAEEGLKISVRFINSGISSVTISNIVPFTSDKGHYVISGMPLANESRSYLFRPGLEPVGVIVPHNNNDLNFSAVPLDKGHVLYGLLKRSNDSIQNYLLNRIPYILEPGRELEFELYADLVNGNWHDALKQCFREKMLYEVPQFDNSLYERRDLDYIKHAYTMHLMMAWEKNYFSEGAFHYEEFLEDKKRLYGGDDIFTIWPTWPVLGLDQRSQWELMADLPGGIDKQEELAAASHQLGTRYFISYNPWDDKDEKRSLQIMSDFIKKINADGVVLDTRAEGSDELQKTADEAKPGVVLYSEGMAVPRDMQGIISGRVHNDIYYPPLLNLNKLIKPDFAIFRVAEVNKERIRREYSLSLFNGHGVEINVMRPGRQDWVDEDYRYWGSCVRILRENSGSFNSYNWTPLIPVLQDRIYVNKWPGERKTVYTIFSLLPEGFHGSLFEAEPENGYHYVDLWNHEESVLQKREGKEYVEVELGAFNRKWLGTNNEGAVCAVARLPDLLRIRIEGDRIFINAEEGTNVKVWAGNPAYDKHYIETGSLDTSFHLFKNFNRYEGKYVIQLLDGPELLDEKILIIPPGTPLLITEQDKTSSVSSAPDGMVRIPGGTFIMRVVNGDEFIAYPKQGYPKEVSLKTYFMDKYPVTNRQFKKFMDASGYSPSDTVNFLKHWQYGSPLPGEEEFPVVHVSYEDARAYAAWAGKRLPTETEWQYAAQTADGRIWPWGNEVKQKGKKARNISTTLTLVDYGTPDPSYCNTGDGKLYPVGSYKKGVNPNGLSDLVGSVWQMTNDWYQNDTYQYIILKGGCYYNPGGSWWYVQGGPKPLHYRQMLLRVSQGFERNATVGFRCVKDAE